MHFAELAEVFTVQEAQPQHYEADGEDYHDYHYKDYEKPLLPGPHHGRRGTRGGQKNRTSKTTEWVDEHFAGTAALDVFTQSEAGVPKTETHRTESASWTLDARKSSAGTFGWSNILTR